MMLALAGRRVLVVGLARSGVAAAKLLCREGAIVTATDGRKAAELGPAVEALLPLGVRFELGGHDEAAFTSAELIVVSPGVPLAGRELVAARAAGVPIIGEAELAATFIEEPVVGITGTNGKSTTTALIGHLLTAAGKRVFLGGNLGTPLSERVLAGGALDVTVAELSSFQLEAVETLRPHVAVVTNLSPDHLDRYPGPQDYYEAKRAIFRAQRESDFAVLNAGDPEVLALHRGALSKPVSFGHGAVELAGDDRAARDDGKRIVVRGVGGEEEELYERLSPALRGRHNRENAMAAILAARLCGAAPEAIRAGLASFGGLPHRLELVRTLRGTEWINDSKATNVDSVKVALAALPGPLVWIAGGLGKGAPYEPLRALLPGRVKAILTIGSDAQAIASALGDLAPATSCGTLDEAVRVAEGMALPGEAVLLSPACASFDQFRSYEHRGAAFRALVEALP
ncbi:UDP-N-acetylmuramoyl-L-alanine--D-glutamate ligase [Vulgatibacter incomptus]|nr:UDP-N-acetylmuramoyl-L-alanine--D-glutamate ligase [Vulgatibacter incomptus]